MPGKSRNVPSSIIYSATGAESFRIARASNNPESFSTAINRTYFPYEQAGGINWKNNQFYFKLFKKISSKFAKFNLLNYR